MERRRARGLSLRRGETGGWSSKRGETRTPNPGPRLTDHGRRITELDAMERILVRWERCVGCRSCELACRVAHSASGNLFSAVLERPAPSRRIFVEQVDKTPSPFLCRQCEDAPCVRSCPTRALVHDETTGLVAYEPARCIGCHGCVMACPFGMIQPEVREGFIAKCDRCKGRDRPACVEACPTHSLVLEKDFLDLRRKEAVRNLVQSGM